MADVNTYLAQILSATYGEEVRSAIHDSINAMNIESSNAMEYAETAVEDVTRLHERIDDLETIINQLALLLINN